MATVLGADMLTIKEPPVIVVPGCEYGKNSGFEGHEFSKPLLFVKWETTTTLYILLL